MKCSVLNSIVFCGFCSCVALSSFLLGYDSASLGDGITTFQGKVVILLSRSDMSNVFSGHLNS